MCCPQEFVKLIFIILAFTSCATTMRSRVERKPNEANFEKPYILRADGSTDPYIKIESVLGSPPETPDCSDKSFGPHITQVVDKDLGQPVFLFHIHVKPDNDRCINTDRQRVEIKTMGINSTPDYLKGFLDDRVTFRWRFKLPIGFLPSYSFTHLHQLKAFDGNDDLPLITLTARKGSPDTLQIIHIDSKGNTTLLSSTTPLASIVGNWVDVYEAVTYGPSGSYSITIKRISDNVTVLSYSQDGLDLWRNQTRVVRPKWGIYRSLQHSDQLRDEDVSFSEFCLAKGSDDCDENIFFKK